MPDFLTREYDSFCLHFFLAKQIVFCLSTLILFMIQSYTSVRLLAQNLPDFFNNYLEAFPV